MVIYIKKITKNTSLGKRKEKKKTKTKDWFDFAFGWNLLIKPDPTKG